MGKKHKVGNSFCLSNQVKTKMLIEEFVIWAFWGQNVGPGLVKNGKKGCFHSSHLSTSPVLNKDLNSHGLLNTLSKLKDELTDLYKTLQKFIFTETNC